MRSLLADAARVLRGHDQCVSPARLITCVVAFGGLYGAVMGAYRLTVGGADWPLQVAYAAAKTPLLILGGLAVTLPALFVLNTLLGLRADLHASVRALLAAQAAIAVALAALAPVTLLWYASSPDYSAALVANGVAFAAATLAGQWALRRAYEPLVRRNPRHRVLLRGWAVAYVLVAVQLAWLLRPFLGAGSQPVRFLREGAWNNAYVAVAQVVWQALVGP